MFNRLRARYLGPGSVESAKRIMVSYRPDLTLPLLYAHSAAQEGAKPSLATTEGLIELANNYLEAHQMATRAQVTAAVDAFLRNAENQGVKTDLATVLGGELSNIWRKATTAVEKVVETEATHARNVAATEGIGKVAASMGIEDPVVVFLGPNDSHTCDECKRLYFTPDGTPKAYLLSDCSHGYHKRGDDSPSFSGCHPACRHSPTMILKGYGFKDGKLAFISHDHDELADQQNTPESA